MDKSLDEINIKDVMTTKIVAAHPDDSVLDVARLMVGKDFEGIPVVDKKNRLLGMISTKELLDREGVYLPTMVELVGKLKVLSAADSKEVKNKLDETRELEASTVMDRDAYYLSESATLEEAVEAFLIHHKDPLPVLDTDKTLVGIVSKFDVLRALTEPFESIKNTRPDILETKNSSSVIEHLGDEFVVVSRTRARFWYVVGFVALAIGIVIAIAFIIRVQLV